MVETTLPFDSRFQGGLLYLLASDYDFLRNVLPEFHSKYLDAGEAHIKLFKLINAVWTKTKKPLTVNILKNSILALKEKGVYSEGDSFGMNNILDAGKLLAPSEYEYIKENVYNFLKHQSMALAFSESLDFYEKKDYDTVYHLMSKAYKRTFGMENSLGLDYMNEPIHDKYNEPPRQGIWSTGFEGLDKFLEGGGFAKKECYTILSSTGRGKCHGTSTPILLYDGSIKLVQDIIVGDKLMGPDGKARNVLSTTHGQSDLYRIIPVKGDSYIVNDVHLLSLRPTGLSHDLILADEKKTRIKADCKDPIFIEAKDLYKCNKTIKHCLKGWRPEAVSFENEITTHPIPPYILGVWLGDGTATRPGITQIDNEVITEFKRYAQTIGASISCYTGINDKCPQWNILGPSEFRNGLKSLNVWGNKHIPNSYKMASIEDRLELLAGLLDTDGSLKDDKSGYDFIQKNKQLAEDTVFIARSLGLAAYVSECKKSIKALDFTGIYYRITIYGDCDKIPVRLPYKKANPRKQKKNPLLTGIKIEPAGYGDYYGFEIDGDKQYLLGDWQVTHNTAMLCNFAIAALKQKLKVLFVTLEMSEKQISQRFDAILSGFSPTELATLPEARVELERKLRERLHGCRPIIKGFDRGRLTLDGFHAYLERYCIEMGTPDVVILDWVGCLKMPANVEKRHEALAELADGIINMSREFNCTILTAHQTNRSAVGNDIYGYDAISESFSSLFGMDVVLTLGASDKAKDAGRRVLSIAKNRFGPDSVYVTLQGSKATESLNFRFREVPNEEEEAELLCPERKSNKKDK